jgi:hypothetical protein
VHALVVRAHDDLEALRLWYRTTLARSPMGCPPALLFRDSRSQRSAEILTGRRARVPPLVEVAPAPKEPKQAYVLPVVAQIEVLAL